MKPIIDLDAARQVLGIPQTALAEIARAETYIDALSVYWRRSKKWHKRWQKKVKLTHPDHGGNPEDFLRVQAAWDLLSSDNFVYDLWWNYHRTHLATPTGTCDTVYKLPVTDMTGGVFKFREPAFLKRD